MQGGKENIVGSGARSVQVDGDAFAFQPATSFDFDEHREQQDPLAGQRRQSLAQLSGIRSKIGVWETKVVNPGRPRPKGVPPGARPILPIGSLGSAGIGRLGAPKRAGLLPKHPAGLPSVTEDAEAAVAPLPPPVAQLISPHPQAPASSPAVPSAAVLKPVVESDCGAPASHAAASTGCQAAAAVAPTDSRTAEEVLPLAAVAPAAVLAAAPAQPVTQRLPTEQNSVPRVAETHIAVQPSPQGVAQPGAPLPLMPTPAEASPLQQQQHSAATPCAATPSPQQYGQGAACVYDQLAAPAADAAVKPQVVPISPALSDASTVSIECRPTSRSALPDSSGNADGTADPMATPAAGSTVVPAPATEQLPVGAADKSAPRSALSTVMERAWSAAGRWATPTAVGNAGSAPAADTAAASPALPADVETTAAEADVTLQAVQQTAALEAAAEQRSCGACEAPTELQTEVGCATRPAVLPGPQSPPPTAERWQLGDSAELQPVSPAATPAQDAFWAHGSPEVFSTPTAELQPPSPGDEDSDSHHGSGDAEGSLQPVPFGLNTPLAAGASGSSYDGGGGLSVVSTVAAGAGTGTAQGGMEGATTPAMLRISPLPDCRGDVLQRERTPELIEAAQVVTPATAEIGTPSMAGDGILLTPTSGSNPWAEEVPAAAAEQQVAPPSGATLQSINATPTPSLGEACVPPADSPMAKTSLGSSASQPGGLGLKEVGVASSCPATPAATPTLQQPELVCPPTVPIVPASPAGAAQAQPDTSAAAGAVVGQTAVHVRCNTDAAEIADSATAAVVGAPPAVELQVPSVGSAAAPGQQQPETAPAGARCAPLSLVIVPPNSTPEEAAEDLPLTSPALSDGSLFSGSRRRSSSCSDGSGSSVAGRQASDPATSGPPEPAPAPASWGNPSPALACAAAAAVCPSPSSSPALQPPAAAAAPLARQLSTDDEPSATLQRLPSPDAVASPSLPPGSKPLSPSLRYAALTDEADCGRQEALLPAAQPSPSADDCLAERAAAEAPAVGMSQPHSPALQAVNADTAMGSGLPKAAAPQPSTTAAAISPDAFRPTAASGFLPFTPLAAPSQQQLQLLAHTPGGSPAELEAAPAELVSVIDGPIGQPVLGPAAASAQVDTTCQLSEGDAGVNAATTQQLAAERDTGATVTPVPAHPAASDAAPLPNSIRSAAPAAEPDTSELAPAPATARKPAVTFAEPATVADCTVSGAWTASPPALAATGNATGGAPAAAAVYIRPGCIDAAQEPRRPPADHMPEAADVNGSPDNMQPTAGREAVGCMERMSVASNLAFDMATPPAVGAPSPHSLPQSVKQPLSSSTCGPYPMTISKLRITEPADADGDMPQAFDGGGLGAAAPTTPSASCFGMQMSPHNAATRQDVGSPNLRVGLTPHIKALRSSLASHAEVELGTAGTPAAGLSSANCLLPSSRQQGDRRESLAEAPRANLLFEPAADAEEAAATARAEAEQLRRQNALLTAEVEGARDAVSQLLDRISGMQVDAEAGSRLLAAKLERAVAENATLAERLEQLRGAKAAEKAQFRALHEQKYLPLKKRCAAAESEVARLEAAAAQQVQDAAARATERERQLHAARTSSAATEQRAAIAQAAQQELQRELQAKAVAAAATGAELARLRARSDEADAAEAANAAVLKENAALRGQLDEVMLSHEAAVQSRDRALAQAAAREEEVCRQTAALKKTEYTLGAVKAELERGLQAREAAKARIAGLQEQLRRVEKDRQDLLEICQGRLAGIPGA